jgi:hypothetical protein
MIILLSNPEVKAAEDSRTPRRCRDKARATPSARSWSAAVLCRFRCFRVRSSLRLLAACQSILGLPASAYRLLNRYSKSKPGHL